MTEDSRTANGYFELLLKLCLIDKEPRFGIFKRLVQGESEELKEKVQSSRRIHKRTIINTVSILETTSICTYQIYLIISNHVLIYLLYNWLWQRSQDSSIYSTSTDEHNEIDTQLFHTFCIKHAFNTFATMHASFRQNYLEK